ncbi:hypothetical protein [Candidatus Sororendozoicomonas aggregata]|uniref:hypothetical protein n=1 Tax=Candidatus Sororendozoicomonas aggregata TaxID=3073239 RepID=UPI002ED47EA6
MASEEAGKLCVGGVGLVIFDNYALYSLPVEGIEQFVSNSHQPPTIKGFKGGVFWHQYSMRKSISCLWFSFPFT